MNNLKVHLYFFLFMFESKYFNSVFFFFLFFLFFFCLWGCSDGKTVGACLDRNGLRPARYWRTIDNVVYVASEVCSAFVYH